MKLAGVGDEAIRSATGKSWQEWLDLLDGIGADEFDHAACARWLNEHHVGSGWWAQMITVGYEQARGLRVKHEKTSGFEIGRSKTLPIALARLYAAWESPQREVWLEMPGLEARTARRDKSMRLTWPDGSIVAVYFWPKGQHKSQVQVQHGKLPDAETAEQMKAWWGEALGRLADSIESSGAQEPE